MISPESNHAEPLEALVGKDAAFFAGYIGEELAACGAIKLFEDDTIYGEIKRVFVASVGFLAFGWANIPMSIWYGHPWSTTAKYLLDALIYGLVVAGTFAWLWPGAA